MNTRHRHALTQVLISSAGALGVGIVFLLLALVTDGRFLAGVLAIAVIFCLGVLAGAMGSTPQGKSLVEFLTRGWGQAWMCVLLGLVFALCGASLIGCALAAVDRRFFSFYPSPGWGSGLIGDIWRQWCAGTVFLLFAAVLGTVGVRELIRRFRKEK